MSFVTVYKTISRATVAGSIAAAALFSSGCSQLSSIVEPPETQVELKNLRLSMVKLENAQDESFKKLQYSVTELQNQMEAIRKADTDRAQNLESIQAQLEAIRKDLANRGAAAPGPGVGHPTRRSSRKTC
jgi:septal ring factor EnvC (AmiA/AmiB activator)